MNCTLERLVCAKLASRRGRRGRRIWALEGLEERTLLSGNPTLFTVTDLSNSAADTGSLPYAIIQANANTNPAGSLIEFDPALYSSPQTIALANTLELSETAGPELIDGPGAGMVTISGNDAVRVFQVDSGTMAMISGLTVSSGLAPQNGAIGEGGGIYNAGTLVVRNATISDCSALPGYGGGIYNAGTLSLDDSTITGNRTIFSGGGIWNDSGRTMTIANSTISDNSTTSFGGGIFNDGTLSIGNSTLSGNSTGDDAGAIENGVDGTLTITSSTLAGNSSTNGVGGIGNAGSLTVMDSIFDNPGGNAGNSLTAPGPITSGGHNLFSDAPAFAVDPTDLINTDPLLGPLADNGGPTQTMALLPGSPAIDAGVSVPGVTTDQRGIPRSLGSAPDIGAFESRGFTLTIASGDDQATAPLSAFPAPVVVVVASPFGEPVAGGQILFDAPTAGASADLAHNPVPIDSNGQASVNAVANGLGGTYTVTAQAPGANTVASTLTNEVIEVIPPTVVGLQDVGVRHQPTTLVLTFSQPMDSARAEDPANYRLVSAGPDHRLGTRDDRVIRVRWARYDAASQSVTLRLMPGQPRPRTLWLTVAGTSPGGLTNADGTPLAGVGTGGAGGDRAVPFNLKALQRPMRIGLLPDGGFETSRALARNQARTLLAGDPALAPWRITAGSVNVQTYWPAAEGMQTLDLNGVSPGTIEQSFATIPGQVYQLLFDYANNPDDGAGTATAAVTVTGDGEDAAEPGDRSCGLDPE